jgi:hypothetical protein
MCMSVAGNAVMCLSKHCAELANIQLLDDSRL